METKSDSIRRLVLERLSDEKECSFKEIVEYINQRNPEILGNNSLVSSVLYTMVKSNKIMRTRKMTYKIVKQKDESNEEVKSGEDEECDLQKIVEELEIIYRSFQRSLKPLTYGLTYEEYIDNQKRYEIQEKISSLLKDIKVYQKSKN